MDTSSPEKPIPYSVKRSDVPLPYFIVLASSVKTKEFKGIKFHRIEPTWLSGSSASQNFTLRKSLLIYIDLYSYTNNTFNKNK